jgi:hypothetical protein
VFFSSSGTDWLHEDGELTVILMTEATIGYHRKMALQICDLGTLKYHYGDGAPFEEGPNPPFFQPLIGQAQLVLVFRLPSTAFGSDGHKYRIILNISCSG